MRRFVFSDQIITLSDEENKVFKRLKRKRFGDVYFWDLSKKALVDTAKDAKRRCR